MRPVLSWQSAFSKLKLHSLPIYSAIYKNRALIYAPCTIFVMKKTEYPFVLQHLENLVFKSSTKQNLNVRHTSSAQDAAIKIFQSAQNALNEMEDVPHQHITLECLTLYVNNQCNMRCRYCYSKPGENKKETLSEQCVRAAARLVAGMCSDSNTPFTLVFHGGGEPTLNPSQVDNYLGIVHEESDQAGIHLKTYIATNGAVSGETARWLASGFDLVGVSCDGPPEIQNRNRPGFNGQPMSKQVERTMTVLKQQDCPFHVRVTITYDTVDRQEEIVTYIADRFRPDEIRIEPVYINVSGEDTIESTHVDSFINSFLKAKSAGARYGIAVSTSITRPNALYGPYCNVLRRVLNLVPGDIATSCFLASHPEEIVSKKLMAGWFDLKDNAFRIDKENIKSLITRCANHPVTCDDCLCSYQCTYGCPDRCLIDLSKPIISDEKGLADFRCSVNRRLMEYLICEAAEEAWDLTQDGHCQDIWDAYRMINVAVYRKNQKDEVVS